MLGNSGRSSWTGDTLTATLSEALSLLVQGAALPARRAHDQLAEPDDQAGFLGQRYEALGGHVAAYRVVPADEGLHALDLACGYPDYRLVMHE